jgi:hypothetical protein
MIRFLPLTYCFESNKIITYSTHFDYALDAHLSQADKLTYTSFRVIRFGAKKTQLLCRAFSERKTITPFCLSLKQLHVPIVTPAVQLFNRYE